MTTQLDELRSDYECCRRALMAERAMRQKARIFTDAERHAKLQEMDSAIAALDRIKETAKQLLTSAGQRDPEQPSLFGVTD